MKESHNENLANYIGRESCATYCEVCGEALTAVHTGWVLSLENRVVQNADTVILCGMQQSNYHYGEMLAHSAWS